VTLVGLFFSYHNDARSNKQQMNLITCINLSHLVSLVRSRAATWLPTCTMWGGIYVYLFTRLSGRK